MAQDMPILYLLLQDKSKDPDDRVQAVFSVRGLLEDASATQPFFQLESHTILLRFPPHQKYPPCRK